MIFDKTVVLVNNLGGASVLEMAILTHELLASDIGERAKLIIGPDAMMTALDMHGFSISVMELAEADATRVRLTHTGWPRAAWTTEPQWPETFAYFEAAWPRMMDALVAHFAG